MLSKNPLQRNGFSSTLGGPELSGEPTLHAVYYCICDTRNRKSHSKEMGFQVLREAPNSLGNPHSLLYIIIFVILEIENPTSKKWDFKCLGWPRIVGGTHTPCFILLYL